MDRQIAHELARQTFARKGEVNNAYADRTWAYLLTVFRGAKKNAASRGRPFTIEQSDLRAIYDACGMRCQVTGVPFDIDRCGHQRAAYAPSIDRIDPALGYERGNVRLVCQIANLAMNVWGADTLREFIATARAC